MALVLVVSACGSDAAEDYEPAVPASTVAFEGTWRSRTVEDPMDGTKTLIASVYANRGLVDHEGRRLSLRLSVECYLERTLYVYLQMSDYYGGQPNSWSEEFDHGSGRDKSIRLKFDDRNVMRLEEEYAEGLGVLFTLTRKKDLDGELNSRLTFDYLVDEILNSETMTVELTPHNAPKQIVTFDLTSGLDAYLPETRELCE